MEQGTTDRSRLHDVQYPGMESMHAKLSGRTDLIVAIGGPVQTDPAWMGRVGVTHGSMARSSLRHGVALQLSAKPGTEEVRAAGQASQPGSRPG